MYDLETHEIFISRDVIFHEVEFPYAVASNIDSCYPDFHVFEPVSDVSLSRPSISSIPVQSAPSTADPVSPTAGLRCSSRSIQVPS